MIKYFIVIANMYVCVQNFKKIISLEVIQNATPSDIQRNLDKHQNEKILHCHFPELFFY